MRRLFAMLAVVIGSAASGSASAEPTYAFDQTPGKLPKTVIAPRWR